MPPPRLPRPARRARPTCSSTRPHSLERAGRSARSARSRAHQRRRLGRRLVRHRRARSPPVPHGHADVGRRRASPRAPTSSSGAFLAAVRLASPGATLDPTPATRRSCRGRGCSRTTAWSRASARASATSCARRLEPDAARGASSATPTARCCSRSCSTASTTAPHRTTRSRASSHDVSRHERAPQPPAHRRRARLAHPVGNSLVRARRDR